MTALEWRCCPGFTGSNCDEGESAGGRGQEEGVLAGPSFRVYRCSSLPCPPSASSSPFFHIPSFFFLSIPEPNARDWPNWGEPGTLPVGTEVGSRVHCLGQA